MENVKNENQEKNTSTITNDIVKSDTNTEPITTNNVIDKRLKNLKPFNGSDNILTTEEAKARGRNGGIKSGEVRKARKTATELLTKILATNLTKDQIEEIVGNATNLLGEDTSAYNVMMIKALQEAMSGSIKAMEFVRDTVGDTVTQKQEIKADISEADKQLIDTVKSKLIG